MQFDQFRIIGREEKGPNNWFIVGSKLTLLRADRKEHTHQLFSALQAVKSLFSLHLTDPFEDFPQFLLTQQGRRRVIPAKKTAAIAIYTGDADLVHSLAILSETLYEVDRIEVGIRRDHSWWMNFVELSSSTRWSEVNGNFEILLQSLVGVCPQELLDHFTSQIRTILPTDRLKGSLAEHLFNLLAQLRGYLAPSDNELYQLLQQAVNLHHQCCLAKDSVYERLPHFIAICDKTTFVTSWEYTLGTPSFVSSDNEDPLGSLLSRWLAQNPQFQGLEDIARGLNRIPVRVGDDNDKHFRWVAKKTTDKLVLRLFQDDSGPEERRGVDQAKHYLVCLVSVYHHLYKRFPVLLLDLRGLYTSKEEGLQLLSFLQGGDQPCQVLLLADGFLENICREQYSDGITYLADPA